MANDPFGKAIPLKQTAPFGAPVPVASQEPFDLTTGRGESFGDITTEQGLTRAPFQVLEGAAKGAGHTLTGAADLAREAGNRIGQTLYPSSLTGKSANLGDRLIPQSTIGKLQSATTAQGDFQNLGYTGEQIGEYMLPGIGEDVAAEKAATLLPQLGRVAEPIARVGYNALTTGGLNKLQGGSFNQGAALGAAGAALGEGTKLLAPKVAESAIGITKRDRGFGRTPGREILRAGGLRPETIADNAQGKLGDLMGQLEQHANQSTVPVDVNPAIKIIDREQIKAINQNAKERYDALHALRQRITEDAFTGAPLPRSMTARQALDIKRGVGDLEMNWNPELRGKLKGTVREVYGALDKGLDQAMPGTADINQRISSLIPVKERAESAERNASLPQRVAHRAAAHTGALASGLLGADIGYNKGGVPGAIAGGLGGVIVPEILISPSTQMAFAKLLQSPTTRRLATGAGAQILSRK